MLSSFLMRRVCNLVLHSDFFLDTSSFTLTSSQVEQSSSSYSTLSQYVDLLDRWRKDREDTLYTDTIGDFSYCESLTIGVRVFTLDHSSLELLDSFLITFFDTYVYIDGITSFE